MISERFLDIAAQACVSMDSDNKHTSGILNSVNAIIKNYMLMAGEAGELNLIYKEKLHLLGWMAKYRKTLDSSFNVNIMLSEMENGAFKKYINYVRSVIKKYTPEEAESVKNFIYNKKKISDLLARKKNFDDLLQDIESGEFEDDNDLINRWETEIEIAHRGIMEIKKSDTRKGEEFDFLSSNITEIMDKLRSTYDEKNVLKTGYRTLDTKILPCGGFENRRIYMIGGPSGVGKSTMLMNLMVNALDHKGDSVNNEGEIDERKCTYLYLTAENLIDESYVRFYCCLTGMPVSEFNHSNAEIKNKERTLKYSDYFPPNEGETAEESVRRQDAERVLQIQELKHNHDSSLQNSVSAILNRKNKNVILRYVESRRTTVADIEAIIENVRETHNLRAVFIDYLDLFSTGQNLEKRHELGAIAQEFKNIAVKFEIPVITATQLNRAGYNANESPSLTQVGESIQKVENSDFVMFINKVSDEEKSYVDYLGRRCDAKLLKLNVLKNRNGLCDQKITCIMKTKQENKEYFSFKIEENNQLDSSDEDSTNV